MSHSWPIVPLGEVLKPVSRPEPVDPEKTYRILGAHWYAHGLYIKDTLLGAEIRADKVFRVERGDFVYNRLFAWKGSFAVATKENDGCYVSNEFPCFVLNQDRADGKYLWRYFSRTSAWDDALELSSGGTPTSRNRLKEEKFLAMKIPLPPVSEQQRIVTRIDGLAAKIAEARHLRQLAEEEAEALVSSFITGALGGIRIDGCLGDVLLEKPRNGWSARCDNSDTGVPVLSLRAITGFRYRETEFKRTSEPTLSKAHYWLQPGDLLITRSNTPELVGHAAIYSGTPSPCVYPDLMMRLSVDGSRADKQFVHCWLRSRTVREHITRLAKGTSPTMKKISQEVVMKIPFPADLSLSLQRRAVAYLQDIEENVDSLKRCQTETAAELDAMLPSILDKAFKGEL